MLTTAADPFPSISRLTPAPDRPFLVAVSGGSDSLALLHLMQRVFSASRLVAVTVDHGLRPESAREAAEVACLCAARGIPHHILEWRGEKPGSGIAEAARIARYRLLAELAARTGALAILTGHTADDQAETILMRRRRGDGPGLAGMADATWLADAVWLVRPLLGARREALRETLRRDGIAWIDDPGNMRTDSERVRMRQALAHSGDRLFEEAIRIARDAASRREAVSQGAARLLRSRFSMPAPGLFRLDPDFASTGEREIAVEALRLAIAAAGGAARPVDGARAGALVDRIGVGRPFRGGLGRATIDLRRAGLFLHREMRAGWTGRAVFAGGDGHAVWDGRFRVADDGKMTVEAAGKAVDSNLESPLAAALPASLVRAARAAEPRAVAAEGVRLPLGEGRAQRIVGAHAQFLPGFDLAAANALRNIIGLAEIPPPPFAGHNAA